MVTPLVGRPKLPERRGPEQTKRPAAAGAERGALRGALVAQKRAQR